MKTKIFLLLVTGVVLALGYWTPLFTLMGYRFFPQYPVNENQEINLRGLKEKVEVSFDEMGIPHLKAESPVDLARAMGFIQWRDRGWQMDFLKHFAEGRLSELLGRQKAGVATTVDLDRAMRGWNFRGRLPKDLESLGDFDREMMLAFLDGVNQAKEKFRPIEYQLLGMESKPWDWQDVYLVSLTQAWSLSHNWEQELVRFLIAKDLGLEAAQEVYSFGVSSQRPTIEVQSATEKAYPLNSPFAPELTEYFKEENYFKKNDFKKTVQSNLSDLFLWRPAASNAWVISSEHSQSGFPILANDMHLNHMLPSLLYLARITLPDREMTGVTLPGLPLIVAGANAHMAWGITSAVGDVMDLVIEKPDPKNPDRVLSESGVCELKVREEILKIKGEPDLLLKLRETCRGFLLNDTHPELLDESMPLIALKWNVGSLGETVESFYHAMNARNVDELRTALQKVSTPVQNITAADRLGNIAFFTIGSLPYRRHHRGVFPVPGWLEKYEWAGVSEAKDLPFMKNPVSSRIINTNNLARDPESHKLLVHIDSAPDYRRDRVEQRLTLKERFTQKDFDEIQLDVKDLRAELILPFILEDLSEFAEAAEVYEVLKSWNYEAEVDSVAMTLFSSLYRHSVLVAMEDKLSPETSKLFLRQRYSTNTVDAWFAKKDHLIWDDPSTPDLIETRTERVFQAFLKMQKDLKANFDGNLENAKWGEVHFHQPLHPFGGKALTSFMNLKKIPLAGSIDTVWKAQFDMSQENHPFKNIAGAAFRFTVDLAEPAKARFAIDTGQSGWPLSPHYDDFYKVWADGGLFEPLAGQEKNEKVLILKTN